MAARNGVSLDTVLRRYLAGYGLLTEFVIEELEASGLLGGSGLQRLLCGQAALFDRLIAAVSEEHKRESHTRPVSNEQRRLDRVKQLLAGERVDTAELNYDLDAHHLGIVANGAGAADAIRALPQGLDMRLLLVHADGQTVWAWFGSRHQLRQDDVHELLAEARPPHVCVALGMPARGVSGWRLTHRQGLAALPLADRDERRTVSYADVALVASMLKDDLLTASLCQFYLAPLERERDGGAVLLGTICAYFKANRNVSAAASSLGVNRNTVTSRLRTIETMIGRPLTSCAPQFEAALRLAELNEASKDSKTRQPAESPASC
jgi:hypothetical protein